MKAATVSVCTAICRVMSGFSMVLVALLALPITYDALMRMAGNPTIWAFQITLYAFIAAGFMANPASMSSGAHFRVTILTTLFPKWKPILDLFALTMTLIFAGVVIAAGVYFVHYSWSNNIVSAALFEVPLWIPQLAIPFGGIGLLLQTLVHMLTMAMPGENETSNEPVGD